MTGKPKQSRHAKDVENHEDDEKGEPQPGIPFMPEWRVTAFV
jgi:hypothetical protein